MSALAPQRLRMAEALFWVAFAACFFLFPGKLPLLTQMLIMGLFAVALDIALGYAGILTVGHAAFFGIGAYAAGLLAKHGWGEPISGLLLALALCGAVGYLLGVLIVRGADLTRLMITIGVSVMLAELANRLTHITGGSDGMQDISMWPVLGLFRFDLYGKTAFVYAFCVVLVAFLAVRLLLASPFGMSLRGIHENRKRMTALGTPVEARLRMAYGFSAAIAGLAGALMAHTTQFVGVDAIGFSKSAEVLVILVVGGTGRLYGGLIGAIVYLLVHDVFSDFDPQYWMFWLGLFLIGIVLLGRGGILGMLAHSRWFKAGRA